jgi:hypothetical protein
MKEGRNRASRDPGLVREGKIGRDVKKDVTSPLTY